MNLVDLNKSTRLEHDLAWNLCIIEQQISANCSSVLQSKQDLTVEQHAMIAQDASESHERMRGFLDELLS